MADHLRKQIRDAAVTALTGLVTTSTRVYPSRVYAMQDANLPGLRVYTNEEEAAIASLGGSSRSVERRLDLVVEACVKENDDFDDTLDAIVKEVEVALAGAQSLGVGVKYVQLRSVSIEMSGDGESPVAVGRMTFDVLYYHALGTPDVAL